jgi:opacity protein-like surface antigen
MRTGLKLFVCALAGVCGAAHAQSPGQGIPTRAFYLGFDIGNARLEADSNHFFGPDVGRQSGHDTGFKLRLGYQLSRYYAMEIGYVDFGQFTIDGTPYLCPPGVTGPCSFDIRSKTRGPFMNLVFSWPLTDQWGVNARLGAVNARVSTREQSSVVAATSRSAATNTALQYGLGVSYELNPRVSLGLDWAQYDQIGLGVGLSGGPAFFDLGSSSLLSLGLTYRF